MRKAIGPQRAAPRNEEARLQNRILGRFGALPGVLLFVNTVKTLPNPYGPGHLTFGLGEGTPDLVGSVTLPNGQARFCGWELKVPGKQPKPHQDAVHKAWRAQGAFVAVVHSEDEFEESMVRAREGKGQ